MSEISSMTTEQLEQHVNRLWGQWMYYEAAERAYDGVAAQAAKETYWQAKAELQLRKSRDCAESAKAAVKVLETTI